MAECGLEQPSNCPLCGGDLIEAEVDHKQPRSRGGTDDLDNLWVVCKACNRAKKKLTLYEFGQRKADMKDRLLRCRAPPRAGTPR